MSYHGARAATTLPCELFRRAGALNDSVGVLERSQGEGILVKDDFSSWIQYERAAGVKDGMQRDVAFQGWAEGQAAGNAQLVANLAAATQQSALVHRTEGHPKLSPIVLKVMHRGWHIKI